MPVSKCAKADVVECMKFYEDLGYDGIFITNHFLDGNINADKNLSYEENINFYCVFMKNVIQSCQVLLEADTSSLPEDKNRR